MRGLPEFLLPLMPEFVVVSLAATAVRTLAVLFLVLIVLAVVLRWLARRGLRSFGAQLFESKSSVLRGAGFELHGLRQTAPPNSGGDNDDEESDADPSREPVSYIEVECTVTPLTPSGGMQHWDPFDFSLVPAGTDLSLTAMSEQYPEGDLYAVEGIDPAVVEDELDKIEGPARMRFLFECPVSLGPEVVLRYYFESLGTFRLPPDS